MSPKITMLYDKNWVPILSDIKIEGIAENLLKSLFPDLLKKPNKTPILDVLNRIKERDNLKVHYQPIERHDDVLIAGRINIPKRTIYFDKSIADNIEKPEYRFVVAHELGHWLLHSQKRIIFSKDEKRNWEFIDTYDSLVLSAPKDLTNPRDRAEHQANAFAAGILMPTSIFQKTLEVIQYAVGGVCRDIGKVYVDDNPSSKREYFKLLSHLCGTFNVSFSSVEIRLIRLGLLTDKRKKAKPSSCLFKSNFRCNPGT